MYYSSRIRGQTVPQFDSSRHVCRICSPNAAVQTKHIKAQDTRYKMSRRSPYLTASSPSLSMAASAMDPWIQIVLPQLPMSLTEAFGILARERCVCWSPCLGRRKSVHLKIERWAEHRPWMAELLSGLMRCNNQPNDTSQSKNRSFGGVFPTYDSIHVTPPVSLFFPR